MWRGFTLIELLVVISIISLLSAVVIVSVSDAREQAVITKALVFENHVNSMLINSLAAEYTFDELSGTLTADTTVIDTSSNSNAGLTKGGGIEVINGVNGGKAVSLDGSQHIIIPDSSSLDMGDELTISLWVYINNNANFNAIVSKTTYNYEISADLRGGINAFAWRGADSGAYNAYYTNYLDKWVHVVVTMNSDSLRVYRNGDLFIEDSLTATTTPNDHSLYLGTRGGSYRLNGALDNVRIYSAALPE